jgi:CRISPR system Cascade subunit CasC
MIVELHLLQNFAPANLNRDDTGSPKDCVFGGHRRARISSQSFKRAIRTAFTTEKLIGATNLSERTKRLVEAIAEKLAKRGYDETMARAVATTLLAEIKLKVVKDDKTEYLLFLAESEIAAAVEIAAKYWTALSEAAARSQAGTRAKTEALPKEIKDELLKSLDGGRAADLALFGRMIADLPEKNVEASCQVAHSLSTNKVEMEFDFYTAVDDLKPDDNAGADMLGTIEFNSSCFYRYANVDAEHLVKNLGGDVELAGRTLTAFLRASVEAIPTGKQNSMAAHNPPSLVLSVVRGRGQWNLANAFLTPIKPRGDVNLVQGSVTALDTYWGKLAGMYGVNGLVGVQLATTEPEHLKTLAGSVLPSVEQVIARTVALAVPQTANVVAR